MAKENVARRVMWPTDTNVLVRLVVLYVGQGASSVIFAAHEHGYKILLVDINMDWASGGIDVPRLMADLLGDQALEAFVNTHPHDDHLKGVDDLSEEVDILAVWHSGHRPSTKHGSSYEKLKKVIDKAKKEHGVDAEVVLEGSKSPRKLGNAEYYVLAPAEYVTDDVNEDDADARRARIHEQCAVLKFGAGDDWLMIPGDADRAAFEKHVTEYHKDRLTAVMLAASHHGSRTFFMEKEGDEPYKDALDAIDPEFVIVSAPTQEESPHDHPHDDAVKLYTEKVGKDNVLHTGDERNCYIIDVLKDGGHSGIADDDGELAVEYGLEEEDDDGDGERASRKSKGPFARPKSHAAPASPKRYG